MKKSLNSAEYNFIQKWYNKIASCGHYDDTSNTIAVAWPSLITKNPAKTLLLQWKKAAALGELKYFDSQFFGV